MARGYKPTAWDSLVAFESHDLVAHRYNSRHGRSASAALIKQINSAFLQGREYFRSAGEAALSVKPLLLHYGVLSLAGGAVLLLDASKREENLQQRHGVEAFDWSTTLASGISNVLDIKLRITPGTFSEFVRATQNRSWSRYNTAPYPTHALMQRSYPFDQLVADGTNDHAGRNNVS